jgi:hypothetical protein
MVWSWPPHLNNAEAGVYIHTCPGSIQYCMISGFCHSVDEISALLRCYTTQIGTQLPTFCNNLSLNFLLPPLSLSCIFNFLFSFLFYFFLCLLTSPLRAPGVFLTLPGQLSLRASSRQLYFLLLLPHFSLSHAPLSLLASITFYENQSLPTPSPT